MSKLVGLTIGVYDLFHIGHLNILKRAKENCDYLIVAVNTDEYTQEYKNKKPIIPYNERAEIISSIKFVDKVVPRNGEDEIELVKKYGVDIFFSGDDWKDSDRHKKVIEDLNKINTRVIYMPYTKHISSTILVKKIKDI